jgi:glutathione S-transferase
MRTFLSESFSPWCERTRWVLLHHRFEFREVEHVPLLGELTLQLRGRRLGGRVSVPLLLEGDRAVMGSLAIAEHLDAIGEGEKLVPASVRASIAALHDRLEPLLGTGRAGAIRGVLEDDEVARDAVPKPLRRLPLATASARLGARFLRRKYDVSLDDIEERLRHGFLEVRETLGGRPYVHDRFSYADILLASALQVLDPVSDRFVPLEPGTRKSFTHPTVAAAFRDLLSWRDALYERHRPLRT